MAATVGAGVYRSLACGWRGTLSPIAVTFVRGQGHNIGQGRFGIVPGRAGRLHSCGGGFCRLSQSSGQACRQPAYRSSDLPDHGLPDNILHVQLFPKPNAPSSAPAIGCYNARSWGCGRGLRHTGCVHPPGLSPGTKAYPDNTNSAGQTVPSYEPETLKTAKNPARPPGNLRRRTSLAKKPSQRQTESRLFLPPTKPSQ